MVTHEDLNGIVYASSWAFYYADNGQYKTYTVNKE